MRRAYPGRCSANRRRRHAARTVGTVSEQDALPETSAAEEGEQPDTGTAPHDNPVPEAYAAFMRTGWGDRGVDLPPPPGASWTPERRERLPQPVSRGAPARPAGGVQGGGGHTRP